MIRHSQKSLRAYSLNAHQAGGFQRKIRQTKVFSLISTRVGDLTAIGKSNYGQPIPLC